jgi:dihydrodipicolinate synthase/N-acetylneuraminate lyase
MNPLLAPHFRIPTGLGAQVPIPLNEQNNIDFPALEQILLRLEPVDFVRLVNAEVGIRDEFAYAGLVSFVREVLAKSVRLLESLPSTETRDVVRYCQHRHKTTSELTLPDGWFVRPPSSRDITVAGLIAHLRSVAESTELPIVAVLTGLQLDRKNRCQIIEAMGEHPNVDAVLLTGPQAMSWPRHKQLQLMISGDAAVLPMFAMGCDSAVSQLAVAFPKKMKTIAETARFGAWTDSRMALDPLLDLMQQLDELPSPAGIKTILSHLSLCEPHMRLPHTPLASSDRDSLYAGLAKLEWDQTAKEPR